MNDPILPEDAEIDARLERLASASRTPALPPELADLPWTVQRSRPRLRLLRGGLAGGIGRVSLDLARLAATIAFIGALTYAAAVARAGVAGAQLSPDKDLNVFVPIQAPAPPEVVIVHAQGDMEVDDPMVSLIRAGISRAQQDKAAAVIIELDTPGGTSVAMNSIVQSVLESPVPTVVWVAPSGARAASAGTFITLAAHLDVMAPATHIGAASPIASNGQDITGTLGEKVMEDARAEIRSIAQQRHPKAVDWADSTVAQAKSYTDSEAIAAGAVDANADTLDAVLAYIDGKTVTISGQNGAPARQVTIDVKSATRIEVGQSPIDVALGLLQDPNIAFVLLVLGVLALLFEFFHPTVLVGLLGALSLVLSFYGAGSLPVNALGVALVVFGIAMLMLEPHVPSHGLLTVGGVTSFVIGALLFYGAPGPYMPPAVVAWPIIAIMAAAATAFGLVVVTTILQNRRRRFQPDSGMVGEARIVGSVGEVRRTLSPLGTIYLDGEEWSARSADGPIEKGQAVRVVGKEGLTLVVTEDK